MSKRIDTTARCIDKHGRDAVHALARRAKLNRCDWDVVGHLFGETVCHPAPRVAIGDKVRHAGDVGVVVDVRDQSIQVEFRGVPYWMFATDVAVEVQS